MKSPLILVTSAEAADEPRYSIRSSYLGAVLNAGGTPLLAAPHADALARLDNLLERIDGIILTGGKDVHPSLFGQEPTYGLGEVFPHRDHFENALAQYALEQQIPILGICRGAQILNVATGGTLHQDIDQLKRDSPILHRQTAARNVEWHKVRLQPDSRLARIFEGLSQDYEIAVNSIHHQAVATLGDGWIASASAKDGILEALELPEHPFALGLQWHPEELPAHRVLFDAFVEAARIYRVEGRI